jgi:cold shock protein
MEGTVKFFNRQKGFGFVSGDDGKDYFVHFTALPQGITLHENDRVSFDPTEGDRGLKAENVQRLGEGSAAPAQEDSNEEDSDEEDSQEDSNEEDSQEDSDEEKTE